MEAFVTKNVFLNVKWLLDPTLKHIDKFRLRKESISCGNYMFKDRKKSVEQRGKYIQS